MSTIREKLAQVQIRYQQLSREVQNPHSDPVLKSLRMAISKLEKEAQKETAEQYSHRS